MKRVIFLGVAILILGGAGVGGWLFLSRDQPTESKIYDPSGVEISETKMGSCFTSSVAAIRDDAWRCTIGNTLYDPCFELMAGGDELVCPEGPWDKRAIKLVLTENLPVEAGNGEEVREPPWAMELANGAKCVALAGTVETVGSVTLTFSCDVGYDAGALVRTSKVWTVLASSGGRSLEKIAVRIAWF